MIESVVVSIPSMRWNDGWWISPRHQYEIGKKPNGDAGISPEWIDVHESVMRRRRELYWVARSVELLLDELKHLAKVVGNFRRRADVLKIIPVDR